ncbi:MAG TPA: MBL fold metallo-hydrolase, partial [Deinococcales bacterium]|nr:MBL fold metallo-hydrolase [Deinococcales bacterium]
RVGGWTAASFPVNHGFNGRANALRFDGAAGRAWVYMPDAFQLEEASLARLAGLDLLVAGASFWEETAPPETRSVHDVREVLALAERVGPRRVLMTHLGHGVDARRAAELPAWAALAADGLEVELP